MTENRYDDELLSAIIDGEAPPESVAAVEADPVAQQRLADMRSGVEVVARPVPEASAERRSQSIAAAMAAATPASPEVTSLSAERHKRTEESTVRKSGRPPGWLIAAAAALILFVLATPVLFNSDGTTETATADDVEEAVTGDDGDEEEAMEDEEEGDTSAAVASDEEEAMEDEEEVVEEVEEEAMEDEEVAEESAETSGADSATSDFVDFDIEVVTSLVDLNELVDDATIAPELNSEDILAFDTSLARSGELSEEVLATEVNRDCFAAGEDFANATPYSLVVLDPFAGGAELVIVEFADDGTTRVLNAETCAVLR